MKRNWRMMTTINMVVHLIIDNEKETNLLWHILSGKTLAWPTIVGEYD